ncbi:uncharacterized protein LOC143486098 isoform X2 [Brachyhypopomus gauderio]|uniref:uncharacterized protein LOC143486098 isoform X2 n=1 Tax=Brachyhypopomus gauderio TaxID=698409 RepID=UPI004041EF0F
MKILVTLSSTLLIVVGSMLYADIRETGTEGSKAVIYCPYAEEYQSSIKYFCKGIYINCESVVKTNGEEAWAFQGRMSLHDNTEMKKIIVTITDLRVEDAGPYGCAIETAGRDPFTVVHLTVSHKPPQPNPSPTSSTPLSSHTTEGLCTMTSGTGNATEATGNSTQQPVLFVLTVTSGILFALRYKAEKAGAETSMPNSQDIMEHGHLYAEIQQNDPTLINVSMSTNEVPAPSYGNSLATYQISDPHPAPSTIYVKAKYESQKTHPGNKLAGKHIPLTDIAASSLLQKQSAVYSVAFQHSVNISSDYATIGLPQN